jgi:hypothetical protein
MIKESTDLVFKNIIYSNIEKNVNMYIRRKYLDLNLDSNEATIGIEVNGYDRKYIKPRNTSFICDSYSNHTLVNNEYTEEKQIIQINYTYGVKSKVPIKKYKILNTDRSDNEPFVKNFIIYEVYMDYIMNFWYNRDKQEVNYKNVIKYKYFIMMNLNLEELKELIKITNNDERIVKYMEEIKKVNTVPEYRQYITEEQDYQFKLNSERHEGEKIGEKRGLELGEKRGLELGEKRGLELGEKRGLELGEKRGLELGAKQQKEKTIIEMLKENLPIDMICRVLKIPKEQVQKYQQQSMKG